MKLKDMVLGLQEAAHWIETVASKPLEPHIKKMLKTIDEVCNLMHIIEDQKRKKSKKKYR